MPSPQEFMDFIPFSWISSMYCFHRFFFKTKLYPGSRPEIPVQGWGFPQPKKKCPIGKGRLPTGRADFSLSFKICQNYTSSLTKFAKTRIKFEKSVFCLLKKCRSFHKRTSKCISHAFFPKKRIYPFSYIFSEKKHTLSVAFFIKITQESPQ